MGFVSTYLNEWSQAKRKHANKIAVLESRIKPIEDELERLDDSLRELEDQFPTWHDNVVAPILAEIYNTELYKIEPLRDVTVLQVPIMLIVPGTDTTAPKIINVLFRLEDKTTGEFFVQVTGYGESGTVQKKRVSNNSLTTEEILDMISKVEEKI